MGVNFRENDAEGLKARRTELTRISPAALINFLLQKCGVHLRMMLNTMVIPLSNVFTQISPAIFLAPIRVIAVIVNVRVKLHLGQIDTTFRT